VCVRVYIYMVQAFYGAGGEDPESFYRAFSWEVLEAALKVRREELEKVFGEQSKGSIVKASREKIMALSKHEEAPPRIWPFGGESSGPINLLRTHPSQSNQFGRLYEAHPDDHRQLQDLDLMVSFANITKVIQILLFFFFFFFQVVLFSILL
jgi:hypothetical protein